MKNINSKGDPRTGEGAPAQEPFPKETGLSGNFLDALEANLAFFSPVEKRIADAALRDPERFTACSLRELSEEAGVSQGSIVNFAGKFAGGGFPALKLRIAACLWHYRGKDLHMADGSDSVKTVLVKNDESLCLALRNTEILNSEQTLASAAARILEADKVEIYGVYRSALVATDLCYQLLQLGISAAFVGDVLTCALSASMLRPGSLVIAISVSGKTKDILDAVRLAKAGGAAVICITGDKNSPLARLSDDILVAAPGRNTEQGMQSEVRVSQLALCDALTSYLQRILDESGKKRFFETESILNSHNAEA